MTTEEYLGAVADVIRRELGLSGGPEGVIAAALGLAVQREVAENFRDFGFPKFKSVLEALAAKGVLRLGLNSRRALAVWPGQGNQAFSFDGGVLPGVLRNEVWRAFVAGHSRSTVGMNRSTGQVAEIPSGGSPEEWVAIPPLDDGDERGRAKEFLELVPEERRGELSSTLEEERWYASFPVQLEEVDPQLARKWKKQRSSRVIESAVKWADSNDVSRALLFPSTRRDTPRTAGDGRGLRHLLLEAVGQMSTEQLLQLPIPPVLIISKLRPDLLQR